jgi:DNA replicative helicase MCM subunit Mcm2 (Cdc46/Mcm family)
VRFRVGIEGFERFPQADVSGFFQCAQCAETEVVEIDRGRVAEPVVCKRCSAERTMRLVHNRCKFADKQMIKLQETPEVIPEGQTPYSVVLYAYDDLVDTVQPGDRYGGVCFFATKRDQDGMMAQGWK